MHIKIAKTNTSFLNDFFYIKIFYGIIVFLVIVLISDLSRV